ncbi:MAG TPA: thioredoxin-disulfide reductase [Spirochaetota bacterium]|nr:thioredoxin-disulfide reductase [Spirochaetota bacterium]HPF07282.1 thioredoxin-disulfide reductase [Spirochaetota bacterium]HPJ41442.1 thioredoxin-disulfide reductase [Spirochaetota bacterium]HPR36457.1 thioredoxin-disulfide reductase [Spirochaetota bacterium]HRX48625.1 thioredoxin-disulfide reductase [Spirochaetota bacterium]
MKNQVKDLIIIGGGPAGLTAGIYGVRAGLDLLLLEKLSPGGQVVNSYEIENYPGFVEPVPGWELMAHMEDQARRLGVSIEPAEVTSVVKEDLIFRVITSGGNLYAKSVIIASGAQSRKLGVPGENEFLGRGVSYCATCDGAFYKDRVTVVIGGGDVALEEAHFLTRFASRVYLIHRRDSFRGTDILQKRVNGDPKITTVFNTVVESINGDEKVNSVSIKNTVTGETGKLEADGVFIFVGYDPATAYLDNSLLNEKREVVVDINMKTGIEGLFAAGDLRNGSRKQIVMAASDGATAALGAYEFLTGNYCT